MSPLLAASAAAAAAVALLVPGAPARGRLRGVRAAARSRRTGPRRLRPDRSGRRLARELSTTLDLLVACLRSGATPLAALAAVCEAAPDVVSARLDPVVAALQLGAPAREAWAGWTADPVLASVGHAMVRAAEAGTAPTTAVERVARRLRAQERAEARQAAHEAGVWAVAPLVCCFLPAFVLVGVAPMVLTLLQAVR